MKFMTTLATVLAVSLCFGVQTSMAQADLGAVSLTAIKSMHIDSEAGRYFADVLVLIQNKSDKTIRLKDYVFDVDFKQGEEITPFGTAPLEEAVINGATGEGEGSTPGQYEATLRIDIGPKGSDTMDRLLQLFNVIGDPSNTLNLILEGTGEVGTRLPNGWASQTGIKLELEFVPTIQREVLFK
jgi:hypothetical protein